MQALKQFPRNILNFVSSHINFQAVRYTSKSSPSEYVTTNLHNGVGRYVCQLQRVTFKFCKEHPNSRGIREFVQNDLLDFVKQNPGVAVYLQPKRHRVPKIEAEYLNGSRQTQDVNQFTREKINKWLELFRTRKGDTFVKLLKKQRTHYPSVQGVWTPFTNMDSKLAVESFPSPSFSTPLNSEKTATEKILELYKKAQEEALTK